MVSRADLLRAWTAVEATDSSPMQLAQTLGFFLKEQEQAALAMFESARSGTLQLAEDEHATPAGAPARDALRAPLFGIVRAKALQAMDARDGLVRESLGPEQYQPSLDTLLLQPLVRASALARRVQRAIAIDRPSRMLDMPRLVRQFAQGRASQRWPYVNHAYAPPHVVVVVDRSAHLRPYRDDHQQLLNTLAKWQGMADISTYTIHGDPMRPLTHWSGGKDLPRPHAIRAPGPDTVLLLLTDMGILCPALSSSAQEKMEAQQVRLSLWARAIRGWRRDGARVLACPPISANLLPLHWPGDVVYLSVGMVGSPTYSSAPASHEQRDAQSELLLDRLLTLLSLARRIEPELVRALRLLDPSLAAEPGLEALVLSRRDLIAAGNGCGVWQHGAAFDYRRKFEALSSHLQGRVLEEMRRVHGVRGRVIEVQETLAWAAHVDPATRARFATEIDVARGWAARLPFQAGDEGLDEDLIAFAAQTFSAQGDDVKLMAAFADVFGPMWGVAHAEAERRGAPRPSSGALPNDQLARWREAPHRDLVARTYHLRQVGEQLRLQSRASDQFGGISPMGMPLRVTSLGVTQSPMAGSGDVDGPVEIPIAGGIEQFSYPDGDDVFVRHLRVGSTTLLRTSALALTVAEVHPPIASDCIVERGRDRYGPYAIVEIQAQHVCFRYIEPGQFLIGSPDADAERGLEEGPQHMVTISEGLWLADTACTQALWQAVMAENPSKFNQGKKGGPEHPVEKVSWVDVQKFLRAVDELLPACRATLPTEAEWEYACRAGTSTPFSFGATITPKQVNYDGNRSYGEGGNGEYRKRTVAVKSLPANPWGLYQMHGNVWEWCADGAREYTAEDKTDPGLDDVMNRNASGGAVRALRGGGWHIDARAARCAQRFFLKPAERYDNTGFRFALRSGSQAGAPEALNPEGDGWAAGGSLAPEGRAGVFGAPGIGIAGQGRFARVKAGAPRTALKDGGVASHAIDVARGQK